MIDHMRDELSRAELAGRPHPYCWLMSPGSALCAKGECGVDTFQEDPRQRRTILGWPYAVTDTWAWGWRLLDAEDMARMGIMRNEEEKR